MHKHYFEVLCELHVKGVAGIAAPQGKEHTFDFGQVMPWSSPNAAEPIQKNRPERINRQDLAPINRQDEYVVFFIIVDYWDRKLDRPTWTFLLPT